MLRAAGLWWCRQRRWWFQHDIIQKLILDNKEKKKTKKNRWALKYPAEIFFAYAHKYILNGKRTQVDNNARNISYSIRMAKLKDLLI